MNEKKKVCLFPKLGLDGHCNFRKESSKGDSITYITVLKETQSEVYFVKKKMQCNAVMSLNNVVITKTKARVG